MPKTKTSSAVELFVALDRAGPEPLHRQLERVVRDGIRSGRLAPLATLPSTRALADQLGVSRGIVVEAYEQLVAEGYLVSRRGGTTRVARAAAPASPPAAVREEAPVGVDFRPSRPDLREFPRARWLRSLRRVLAATPSERLGYLDGRGVPELRHALASYLNRVRGTCAEADEVVISVGFSQALGLVSKVLRASGARRLGMEDGSIRDFVEIVRTNGLEPVAIPVDEAGLRVDRLDEAAVDAVLVTPAHQYPLGCVMPPERRAALAAWAERRNAVIVEDDYDAEFRYDREPIGALQGLSPVRVVYAGSASKILAPGLRLGWLVAPPPLAEALGVAKMATDHGSPVIDQLTLADFLEHGELDRHLRRMRPIYRRRRDALLQALATYLKDFRPVGASAGLHVLAWLPPGLDEQALVEAAAEAGIALVALGSRLPEPAPQAGIIFGYGSIDEAAIEPGIRRLAAVIGDLGAGNRYRSSSSRRTAM